MCMCGLHRCYLNSVISLSKFTGQKCSGIWEFKCDTVMLQVQFCSIRGFSRGGYEELGLLRCFAGSYCLHLDGWRVNQAKSQKKQVARWAGSLLASFTLKMEVMCYSEPSVEFHWQHSVISFVFLRIWYNRGTSKNPKLSFKSISDNYIFAIFGRISWNM